MTAAYILSDNSLTLFHDNVPTVAHRSHPRWTEILAALKEARYDDVVELARPIIAVTRFLDGDPDFTIDDQTILFQGEPVHDLIQARLFEHMKADLPTKPLANFVRRLANNPDYWVADQLYPFIEKGRLPLTEDGCFLAYKRIRNDYSDVHSGTVDYNIGNVVTMPRQKVDNDRNRTCSAGLHACSLDYLRSFSGERLVAVKIDPADVVSVPSDYNDTKLRCCRMEVVAELDNELAAPAWTSPVFDYPVDEDEDESETETGDEGTWLIRRDLDSEITYWDHVDQQWSEVAWSRDCGYESWDNANAAADALRTVFNGTITVTDAQ